MDQKECIIVVGPTAVGKTTEAIRIAQALGTEIISADSRQCYKELNIGVARPNEQELSSIKHHFVANHSITENITAASFEKEALHILSGIFKKHNHAVVCGGTGLYIKALTDGLDEIPAIPDSIRKQVINIHQEKGISGLREFLLRLDPAFEQQGDTNNPHRMMRALEVLLHTGVPISTFQKSKTTGAFTERKTAANSSFGTARNFTIRYKFMEMPREELYSRINNRVEHMMEEGLEKEARSLLSYRMLPALQTVGYKELFDFFDGKCSREDAVEKIKQHTRNYAKRQITWFTRLGKQ